MILHNIANALGNFRKTKHGSNTTADDSEISTIIFDWDDTLLPTSFLMNTVLPGLHPDLRSSIPRDCKHWDVLAAHAHVVDFVLRVARRAARVAIVTNSMSPWVLASAERYLPGLDIESLLKRLEIPVHYARRHVDSIPYQVSAYGNVMVLDHTDNSRVGVDIIPAADGSLQITQIEADGLVGRWNAENPTCCVLPGDRIVEVNGQRDRLAEECRKRQIIKVHTVREVKTPNPYTEAKVIDMTTCLNDFYNDGEMRRNVISIGDSEQEQAALKQVLEACPDPGGHLKHLCKTVNLLDSPTVEQLSTELKILMVWLSRMVKFDKDFDLAMDKLDNLEQHLFEA